MEQTTVVKPTKRSQLLKFARRLTKEQRERVRWMLANRCGDCGDTLNHCPNYRDELTEDQRAYGDIIECGSTWRS